MRFYSPEEDVVVNTLAAVPSCIERLNFLFDMRETDDEFVHWGLERVHGKKHARAAMNQAYRTVLRDLLKIPITDLWQEIEVVCADVEERSNIEYVRQLSEAANVPPVRQRADELHLRFILNGLLLAATARRANRNA
jgi:hypothetical protein